MKKIFNMYISLFIILLTFTSCGSDNNASMFPYTFNKDDTIYEDAEDGKIGRWQVIQGHPVENVADGANGSARSILLRENWLRDGKGEFQLNENGFPINDAHYELPLNNDTQFIIEFDKKKKESEEQFCFTVGIKLETQLGERLLSFNPFYAREGMQADTQILDDNVLEFVFPLSMDYVDIGGVWKHLRFDLVKYLHQFEPDNEILLVTAFYFQGGDDYLDNIRLVSE